MNPIPYGKQFISDEDLAAVNKVLQSDFLTQGPSIAEFEKKFSEYINVAHSVALANGTAALHLAAIALGIQPGQKVITTPLTFAASANCILYAGGEVDFVDIDPITYTIDLDKVESKLAQSKPGEYAGIIPVDFAGYPVDLERLRGIADKYQVWILEDACHAPGGYFIDSYQQKQNCGNGHYADAAIFSFHPVKHIATGEGGMITTNREDIYQKLNLLRTHGITKDPNLLIENHGAWYYEMQDLGFNYRLTDFQAALGTSQLKRADENIQKRHKIADFYNKAFQNTKIQTPKFHSNAFHAYHLYIIQVEKRKELYDYLREQKIYTQVHYIPVHMQPYYKNKGWKKGDFPIVEAYYEKCLSLPMYPTLSEEEQAFVIEKVVNWVNS